MGADYGSSHYVPHRSPQVSRSMTMFHLEVMMAQRIWDLETPASFTGGIDGGSTLR